MIIYQTTTSNITPAQLTGFFTHWSKQPSADTLLKILQGSDHIVIALAQETQKVIGYITAISDGVSCAYIPHLEVRESYRGKGIGSKLVRSILDEIGDLYMTDLMCDDNLAPFYTRLGFTACGGMIRRNYSKQDCRI